MTPVEWSVVAGACYVGLEYWLGKTDKVKAGSALEAVLLGVKSVCGFFSTRKP
jgi:hypothetical protein